ncbi:uncharacterized protein LOC5572070 [Aedes aegypti]|uniref:Activin types I and II receptor domain-containing protein n=1 Tax=Aedes aegypti TaxID=7159 RepID=A0A903VUU9_AEDAE|nr:uncharacterized protein LOC5572070 [Aedes aegypti]
MSHRRSHNDNHPECDDKGDTYNSPAAASSRILRHTNSKRSSSSSPNDYSDSATGSLVKEQHHRHQQQQQINGKYLNSNENGGSEDSAGIETPAGATLFSSSASSSLSSSLSSPLSHNSPQTLTLTADKNKTKLLKCHCDICKDQNYVCETDGLCFTSLSLEHGVYKYSYRYDTSLDSRMLPLVLSKQNKGRGHKEADRSTSFRMCFFFVSSGVDSPREHTGFSVL